MRLLLLSDTHLPKRARELPAPLLAALPLADVVIHAGDWVDTATLDLLESRSRRLVAVYGNNDGPGAPGPAAGGRPRRTRRVCVSASSTRPAAPGAANSRCAERFPDLDVLVFGHSHIPWDSTAPTGLRLLNPGSPTDRRRMPHCTYLTARRGRRARSRTCCSTGCRRAPPEPRGPAPRGTTRRPHG